MSPLATVPASALALAEAVRRFVPRKLWIDFEQASQEFARFPPGIFIRDYAARLNKTGVVPNVGLAKAARDDMNRAWERIEHTFTGQLVAGSLIIYAQSEPPFGSWQALAPQSCRGMHIKDLHSGHVTAPNFDLVGVYVTEAQSSVADVVPATTGGPGRPSSMHLIEAEFARRAEVGLTEPTLPKECKVLAGWRINTHPDMPRTTPKAIENKLRAAFRRLQRR